MLSLPWKAATIGATTLLVGAMIYIGIMHWRLSSVTDERDDLKEWQQETVLVIQDESGNPEVTPGTAKEQIRAMGRSLANLSDALDDQNAAVRDLARQRDEAIRRRQEEADRRAVAVANARELVKRMEARAATPAEDSDAAIREMQDEAYEEGL